MKATLSLLALVEFSASSRMLLQYRPQFPAIPRPAGWTPGSGPATPNFPAPAPAVTFNPVVILPSPAPAGNGRPAPPGLVTAQPTMPWSPNRPVPAPAPAVVPRPAWFTTAPPPTMPMVTVPAGMGMHVCEQGPPMPGMPPPCSMVEMTVTNPINGFSFECATNNACAGSTVNIVTDLFTTNVGSYTGIDCADTGACDGATFNFVNGQEGGGSLEIDALGCNGTGSCSNMEIVLGYNTWLMGVHCSSIEECANCKVRTTDPLDPPTTCFQMAAGAKYPA